MMSLAALPMTNIARWNKRLGKVRDGAGGSERDWHQLLLLVQAGLAIHRRGHACISCREALPARRRCRLRVPPVT